MSPWFLSLGYFMFSCAQVTFVCMRNLQWKIHPPLLPHRHKHIWAGTRNWFCCRSTCRLWSKLSLELPRTVRPLNSGLLSMFAAVWGEPVSDLGFVCTVITEMLFSCFEKLPRGKWTSFWLSGGKNKVPSASNPTLLVLGRSIYRRQAWEGRSMCWEEEQGRFFQCRCGPGCVTACLVVPLE